MNRNLVAIERAQEFTIRNNTDDGRARWDTGTDVECHPLDPEEITLQEGLVYLTCELHDFEEARQQGLHQS